MHTTPLAYFLTWTAYGQWLHGDPRGSVHKHRDSLHSPLLEHDPELQSRQRSSMRSPPLTLSPEMRNIVARVIQDHGAHRHWPLHVHNVRTNHVHVVITAYETPPVRVMSELKSWATRRLRAAELVAPDQRVWTRHGSTRYLWNEESVHKAVVYVRDMQ